MSGKASRWLLLLVTVAFISCETAPQTYQAPQVTAADEMAAITRLHAIAHAEALYQIDSGGSYATLEQLIEKGLVNNPSSGKLAAYRFQIRVKPGGFEATAVPERYPVTGRRSFYVDESRVVRAADRGGAEATAADPTL